MYQRTPQFPVDKPSLARLGELLVNEFCKVNDLPYPTVDVLDRPSDFGACAYYRDNRITTFLPSCARPAPVVPCRNWSWPGATVDREPYGVICHELGHHVDYHTGQEKHAYSSDYCTQCRKASGEAPLTNYCPDNAEWFAEMFRLFLTNSELLKLVRPRTYNVLRDTWTPVVQLPWAEALGSNVPERIVRAQQNKIPIRTRL